MPAVFLDLEKLPTWGKDWWRERDSRPKHTTAWTKNAAEKFCVRLRLSVCFYVQTRLLFKDFRDVLHMQKKTKTNIYLVRKKIIV